MSTATATPRPKSTTKPAAKRTSSKSTPAVNTKPAAKRAASTTSKSASKPRVTQTGGKLDTSERKPATKAAAKSPAKSTSEPATTTGPTNAEIKAIAAPKAKSGQHVYVELLPRPAQRANVQTVLDSINAKSSIVGTHVVVVDSEASALYDASWKFITETIDELGRVVGMFPTECVRRTLVKRLEADFGLSKPRKSSARKNSKPDGVEAVSLARLKRDEHAALRTWVENGSKGKRPETPNLDEAMQASAIAKGKSNVAKAAAK